MSEPVLLKLPLFEEPDYRYHVVLENISYSLRFYYNLRQESWALDISYSDGEPIIKSVRVVPNFPMLADEPTPFSGYFALIPRPREQNETIINPYDLWKYYELYYVYLPN